MTITGITKSSERGRRYVQFIVVLAVLGVATVLALRMTHAPDPVSPAGGGDFSVDGAMAIVGAMATEPHPAGSAANAKVGDYLVDHLRLLGMSPEVQTADVLRRSGDRQTVHNIIARLPGKNGAGKRAVMLAAHFDSVDAGPGAADDGAGVAALLETARALRAGAPLDRDVILMITDGEEKGLLGARGFFERPAASEWKQRIGVVMNFEARGTAGPSVMFETAPHNLALIRHFAAAAPYPNANSLSYDVYRLLPNDTDFTVFRRAGLKGLNFAFIGNYFYSHTKNDSLANLDRGSLYHHGSSALAMTRHFASLKDAEMNEVLADDQPDAVYFNIWPTLLVRYSAKWIWPLAVLQLLLTGWVLRLGFKRGYISGRGVAGAGVRLILALVVTPVAVYGLMRLFHPARTPEAFNLQLQSVAALSAVITLMMALEFRRSVRVDDLAATGLILFSLLSIPINIYLPGGSFIMLWPVLFATGGFWVAGYLKGGSWGLLGVCLLAVLPTIFVLVPLDSMVFTALRLEAAPFLCCLVVMTVWMVVGMIAVGLLKREMRRLRFEESGSSPEVPNPACE